MHRRATHVIWPLVAAAIFAVTAPITQAAIPNPERAYAAAWESYRGLPGGPPSSAQAYAGAWGAYRGLPGGPRKGTASRYPQLESGRGFSFMAPKGWPVVPAAAGQVMVRPADRAALQQLAEITPDYVTHELQRQNRPTLGQATDVRSSRSAQAYVRAWGAGWAAATPVVATGSRGFDWGDAGIGAAGTVGILFFAGGVGIALSAARKHRRRVRHA